MEAMTDRERCENLFNRLYFSVLPAAYCSLGNGCGKRQLDWCKEQVDLTCFLTKCLLVEIILGGFWHNLCLSGNLTHCERSVFVSEHVKLTLPNGTVGGFWLVFMEYIPKLLPDCLKSHKNVNRSQWCKKTHLFYIVCQLASTCFFLALLPTILFSIVLGIIRYETCSAFLWKLFYSPHKTFWGFSLIYISWSLDSQSRTCTQTVRGCLPVSFGKTIRASLLLLSTFVQPSEPVNISRLRLQVF